VFTTTNGTIIQMLILNEVRGRVMSLMMMTFGLTPLGTLPVSAVAEAFGVRAAVASASVPRLSWLLLIFFCEPPSIDATHLAAMKLKRRRCRASGTASAGAALILPPEDEEPVPLLVAFVAQEHAHQHVQLAEVGAGP
jgi:hypothetical protein